MAGPGGADEAPRFPSGALRPEPRGDPGPHVSDHARGVAIGLLVAVLATLIVAPLRRFFVATFWHPVAVDALNRDAAHVGARVVEAGLSPLAGVFYGGVLALVWLLLYEPVRRRGLPFDDTMVVASLPWVALVPACIVLLRSGWFDAPLVYAFVSPPVFLVVGAGLVGVAAWGLRVQAHARRGETLGPRWALPVALLVLVAVDLVAFHTGLLAVAFDPPWWVHVGVALGVAAVWWSATHGGKRATARMAVFHVGLFVAVLVGVVIAWWVVLGEPWAAQTYSFAGVESGSAPRSGGEPLFVVAPLFAAIVTSTSLGAVFGQLGRGRGLWWASTFTSGASAAAIFAHAWDAWVVWVGARNPYDLAVGWQRGSNPVAQGLLGFEPLAGLGYVAARLGVVLAALWVLDRVAPGEGSGQVRGVIKLGLVVMGVVPGTIDALRIALGV